MMDSNSDKSTELILENTLQMAQASGDYFVKNEKMLPAWLSSDRSVSFLTDFTLPDAERDYDEKQVRMERYGQYENTD